MKMDITKYDFPELNGIDIIIPTIKTDNNLLEEASKRGFYDGHTPYNDLFSKLFFEGGTIHFKKDLDKDFKAKALPYLKAFMASFEPAHEDKEAICALLLSELVEVTP